ncbi:MAG: 4-alpha-glucanotransferase [Frankia sp.]
MTSSAATTTPGGPSYPRDPAPSDGGDAADPALADLAAAYGVATAYDDAGGRRVTVAASTVRTVLGLLGVDAADPVAALAAQAAERAARVLPAGLIVRRTTPTPVTARLPVGARVRAWLELDSGGRIELPVPGQPGPDRPVPAEAAAGEREPGGEPTGRDGGRDDLAPVPIVLPAGLPLGDHRLRVTGGRSDGPPRVGASRITVVPDRMPDVLGAAVAAARGSTPRNGAPEPDPGVRVWGWMAQLYALRSSGSWGIGDFADLATLARWSGSPAGGGAGVLLVNPLHASAPTLPVAPSPYYPASRRFASPLYLRPQDLPEFAAAGPEVRNRVAELGRRAAERAGSGVDERIDRDAVWTVKLEALELLWAETHPPEAAGPLDSTGQAPTPGAAEPPPGSEADRALDLFATWCALAERHGPDWRAWPSELCDPDGPAVRAARIRLAPRIAFHAWLQRCCDGQLAAAQAAARAAGMPVGIVHDLAVGVDPAGADVWADQRVFVTGASVGAPPDSFNQVGQDWGLPPWHPDRLAETNYDAFRQMLRAVLRRGGGVRIDHVLGLFRLWWIPAGEGPAHGTYVHYDAEALLGVLALEATRAGALIVGEDLGTVAPSVTEALDRSGVLGSAILWFEQDSDGEFLAPSRWRGSTMASVTTHDLPTATGFLLGDHVRLRAGLGVLGRPAVEEYADWWRSRAALLRRIAAQGRLPAGVPPTWLNAVPPEGWPDADLGPGPGNLPEPEIAARGLGPPADWLEALALEAHRLLVASPARVVLAAPGDALGDRRQPNLPGTTDEYPNWRLPVADAAGRPVDLERLQTDPAVGRLVAVLRPVGAAADAADRAGQVGRIGRDGTM